MSDEGKVMSSELAPMRLSKSTHHGVLRLGDVRVECHVLENGTRLITQRGVLRAMSVAETTHFERFRDRIPNRPDDLEVSPTPFSFRGTSLGITAEQFVQIVTLYAQALVAGVLRSTQVPIGQRCAAMLFALAGVGIAALIDEATGYRTRTPPNALEQKMRLFLLDAPSIERERRFPSEYWQALSKLYGVPYVPGKNPPFFQMVVRRAVHDVVDTEVAQRIKERNPEPRDGSLHYQHYTDPALAICDEVIRRNITVMRMSGSPADFWMRHACEFKGAGLQLAFGPGAH